MEISQMTGFMLVLGVSALCLVGSHMFGHDGDISADGSDDVSHDGDGPSLLSFRNLFLFGLGFGAAGAIATHLGLSLVLSCIAGLAAGVIVALIGWWFYRTIGRQQATTNTNTQNLVGRRATVSTYIPIGQMGQVVTTDEYGSTVYLVARSSIEGQSFVAGETVSIVEAAGNLVRVARQAA